MSRLSPALIAEVDAMLMQAADGDRLVKTVQDCLQLFRRNHLLSQMRLGPMDVGVHPRNRDGAGIICADCHELLDNVLSVGFVPGRITALAVEVVDESVLKFNEDLVHGACGQLGEMRADRLKAVSLAGSHTNFMLRLLAQGGPHESPFVSVNGRLNMELVEKRDPALAEHARTGLLWDVLAKEIAIQWPNFLGLVQSAMNATLQKQESELQLLRRVHGLIAAAGKAEFAQVKKAALASKPPCAQCLPGIYQFALKYLACRLLLSRDFFSYRHPIYIYI